MFVFSAIANMVACVVSFFLGDYILAISCLFGFAYSIKLISLSDRVKELENEFDKLNKQINPSNEEKPTITDETPAD